MASIGIMIGGAALNAAAFTGGNYLAKHLASEDGQAVLTEKTWHYKALEAYQAAMEKLCVSSCSSLTGLKPTEKSKIRRSRTLQTPITLRSSTIRDTRL